MVDQDSAAAQVARIPGIGIELRNFLLLLCQKFRRLEGTAKEPTKIRGDLNMEEGKLTNLPTPAASGDAVPLGYLQANYSPSVMKAALEAGSKTAISLKGLTGRANDVQPARLRVIPQGDPFPSVGQDYELIRIFTAGAWALYFWDPTVPGWVSVL